ncbi:MAG: hypothetical protein E6J40_15295, partial [Chloroflexi bacterium]
MNRAGQVVLLVLGAGQDLDQLRAIGDQLSDLFSPNLLWHPVPLPYSRRLMMLSIGDLVLDVTVAPKGPMKVDDDNPANITVGGGGQAANFCAWAAALGEQARLVTRVGEDDAGRLLIAQLETIKVEVRVV